MHATKQQFFELNIYTDDRRTWSISPREVYFFAFSLPRRCHLGPYISVVGGRRLRCQHGSGHINCVSKVKWESFSHFSFPSLFGVRCGMIQCRSAGADRIVFFLFRVSGNCHILEGGVHISIFQVCLFPFFSSFGSFILHIRRKWWQNLMRHTDTWTLFSQKKAFHIFFGTKNNYFNRTFVNHILADFSFGESRTIAFVSMWVVWGWGCLFFL